MTSASISTARRAAVVSVVKYGLPVPAARITTRPFSRWRTGRLARPRSGSGLPDVKSREAPDRDVLLQLGDVLRDQLLHRAARLAEVLLLEQAVVLEEILDLALDDAVDHLLGLAVLARLRLVDLALGDEHFVRHVLAADPARPEARDLQRQLLRQLAEVAALGDKVGFAVDLDEHAQLRGVVGGGRVEVGLDDALPGHAVSALGGLGDALLAEDGERLVEVPAGLLESVLAVHHPRARHLPELADELGPVHAHGHQRASSSSAPWPMNSSSGTVGR